MDLLSEIIRRKRGRLEAAKASIPFAQMRAQAETRRRGAEAHRLVNALSDENKINIIAEFKRRSPSKGEINSAADPASVARIYEAAGAAAISVLTEEDSFAGSLDDLRATREATSLAILRKDFIFDEFQVYESAAAGADALLLIVAALNDETLERLRRITEDELGMDALVEVHTQDELARALRIGARLIGVNNRDLRTFEVSTATSAQLVRSAPEDAILVSESGLNPESVRKLRAAGYKGFLVGEALMRAGNPETALRDFVEGRTQNRRHYPTGKVRVKICGITSLADARAAVEAGADMLGFNFYRPSPRFIEPGNAREIIDGVRRETRDAALQMVGVFVNEPSPEAVLRIADEAGLDAVQLHGDESREFCQDLKALLRDRVLIKVVREDAEFEAKQLADYRADAIMLDAFHAELRGGTGTVSDWAVARRVRESAPKLFLAGGLSAQNVSEAIAAVQPYAVDACSALESSPGKKEAGRMKAFVHAVRSA